jgi:hypothetical protein
VSCAAKVSYRSFAQRSVGPLWADCRHLIVSIRNAERAARPKWLDLAPRVAWNHARDLARRACNSSAGSEPGPARKEVCLNAKAATRGHLREKPRLAFLLCGALCGVMWPDGHFYQRF